MKKNIGSTLALYPTPATVVGTMVNDKPTYTLVAHVGIIGHDRILVSMAAPHYANQGIKETRALTVAVVDEDMLPQADYVGIASGHRVDKSEVFTRTYGETGAPIIEEAPVVMECTVDDIYETKGFETFICTINAVHVDEEYLNEDGKINYHALKPVLFEMPTYEYLRTGDVIGPCTTMGKEYRDSLSAE